MTPQRTRNALLMVAAGLWVLWAIYTVWAILAHDLAWLGAAAYIVYAMLQAVAVGVALRGWTRTALGILLALIVIPLVTFFQPLITLPTSALALASVLLTDRQQWNRILRGKPNPHGTA